MIALATIVSASPLARSATIDCSARIESNQVSNGSVNQIPADVIAKRDLGIRKYRERDFVSASKLLKDSLKKNPADYLGWQYFGLSLLSQRKFKDSSKAFETAIKLHPDFAEAHVGLGYSLLSRNKLSDAKQEAERAIRLNNKLADAYYVLGAVQLRYNLRSEALDSAETAIKLGADFAPAYLLKSVALVDSFVDGPAIIETPIGKTRARIKEAADALEKYLQLNPNDPDKEDWLYQLSSLRFHSSAREPGQRPAAFIGKEVTTKARVLKKPEPSYTEEATRIQL